MKKLLISLLPLLFLLGCATNPNATTTTTSTSTSKTFSVPAQTPSTPGRFTTTRDYF